MIFNRFNLPYAGGKCKMFSDFPAPNKNTKIRCGINKKNLIKKGLNKKIFVVYSFYILCIMV